MTTFAVNPELLSKSATFVHRAADEMGTNASALTAAAGALGSALAGSLTAAAWSEVAQHAGATVTGERDATNAFAETVAGAAAVLARTERALADNYHSSSGRLLR